MHKKRYTYNIIEEEVRNPKYLGYRGGRVEVFDRRSGSEHPVTEARFLIPEELIGGFRELFDGKSSDVPVVIDWAAPPGHHHNR